MRLNHYEILQSSVNFAVDFLLSVSVENLQFKN